MKKFFTLFAAALVVLSASAITPVQRVANGKFAPVAVRPLQHKAVKHAPAAALDAAYTIVVDNVTATGADITVTPSGTDTYYWDVIDKASYDMLVSGQAAAYGYNDLCDYIKYILDYYVSYYAQYGYDATYADFLYDAEDSYTYTSLDPETEYVVFAVAVDAEGNCGADIVTEGFTTGAVEESDLAITMSYANDILTINTTNSDDYFFWVESKDDYDSYQSDLTDASLVAECEDWIATLDNYGYTSYAILNGNQSMDVAADFWATWFEGYMENGAEYIAMAVPYAGAVNGTPAYCIFTYNSQTAVENVEAVKATKVVENGQLVIIKNGVKYNAQGAAL